MSKQTNKDIAEQFSSGKFEVIYPVITPDIEWYMIGQSVPTKGKQAVVDFCNKMKDDASNSQFTNFNTLVDGDHIAVQGFCTYMHEGKPGRVDYCDVFEFEGDQLRKISSYAIEMKK